MIIKPMTSDYASDICCWQYEGLYSIFNLSKDDIYELVNGDYYACLDDQLQLIGYFCTGQSARIPTSEPNCYDDQFLDIGLGLKPEYCGKKLGYDFLKEILMYLNKDKYRLTVASFNTRAIKVYEKLGFIKQKEVTHFYSKKTFYILVKED